MIVVPTLYDLLAASVRSGVGGRVTPPQNSREAIAAPGLTDKPSPGSTNFLCQRRRAGTNTANPDTRYSNGLSDTPANVRSNLPQRTTIGKAHVSATLRLAHQSSFRHDKNSENIQNTHCYRNGLVRLDSVADWYIAARIRHSVQWTTHRRVYQQACYTRLSTEGKKQ
jgi:hypothetical protein